jgi:hypothetical protein
MDGRRSAGEATVAAAGGTGTGAGGGAAAGFGGVACGGAADGRAPDGFDGRVTPISTAAGLLSGLPGAILGVAGFAGVGPFAAGLATALSASGLAGFAGAATFLAAAVWAALAGAA